MYHNPSHAYLWSVTCMCLNYIFCHHIWNVYQNVCSLIISHKQIQLWQWITYLNGKLKWISQIGLAVLLDLHIIYRVIDTESDICVRQGSFLSIRKMRKVVQLCVFYYFHFDRLELLHIKKIKTLHYVIIQVGTFVMLNCWWEFVRGL